MLHTTPQVKPKVFEYEIKKLSNSEKEWFGTEYLIRCTNYSWFPTEKIMGVKNRIFVDSHNIGAKITGNMGSATIGVNDIEKAKKILGIK